MQTQYTAAQFAADFDYQCGGFRTEAVGEAYYAALADGDRYVAECSDLFRIWDSRREEYIEPAQV